MTKPVLKYASASVVADASLSDRQIRVVANSGKADRVKDVLVAAGCKLDNYRANPIVLADHNRSAPIGNFVPEIKGSALEGVITFAPAGISAKADEYCGLYKAGVMKSVSVGFNAIDYEANKDGGYDFKQWELVELSCVTVPCDPAALTTQRAFGDADGALWKVGASLNLPFVNPAHWDAVMATEEILKHAGFGGPSPDYALARKGFLAYDAANPKDAASYQMPFAAVVDGRLGAVPAALRQISARLNAAAPVAIRDKAAAVVAHYGAKMAKSGSGVVHTPVTPETAPRIKGLYDVAYLAQLLTNLGYVHSDAVREAVYEGDGSGVPAMLANALKVLANAFLAMTQEEVAELLAGHDIEIETDDPIVMAAPTPIAKTLLSAMTKAGRVLSAANLKHLDEMQKCLAAAGDCHTKALDSHAEAQEHQQGMADHVAKALDHVKAMKTSGKPKPAEADAESGDAEDDTNDADVELAAEAERRKRALDLVLATSI